MKTASETAVFSLICCPRKLAQCILLVNNSSGRVEIQLLLLCSDYGTGGKAAFSMSWHILSNFDEGPLFWGPVGKSSSTFEVALVFLECVSAEGATY